MTEKLSRAVALLRGLGLKPSTVVLSWRLPATRKGGQRQAFAADGAVHLEALAKVYARGTAKQLAGVVAHEGYHLEHGPDEAPAYRRQLEVLRRLGASDAEMRDARVGLRHAQEGTA